MSRDLDPHGNGEATYHDANYPPFVTSAADRERWDLAIGIAEQTFGEDGPAAVWGAARAIYNGPIPTWSE